MRRYLAAGNATMPNTTHTRQRVRRISRGWVVLCCLLSLTSSFNLTFLTDILDRNLPVQHLPTVAEVEEDIDEDLVYSSAAVADGRRGERKPSEPRFEALQPDHSPASRPHATRTTTSSIRRAGSEHALRNGLGVPLLC